jgi:hypothetical protein
VRSRKKIIHSITKSSKQPESRGPSNTTKRLKYLILKHRKQKTR